MKKRKLKIHADARADLRRATSLVRRNDGSVRARQLVARIEAFILRLADFAEIGTTHNERREGLRTVGVPGLQTATIAFVVSDETVTVFRISYLGQDVMADFPILQSEEPINVGRSKKRGETQPK